MKEPSFKSSYLRLQSLHVSTSLGRLKEGETFELTLNFVLVDNTIHTVKTDVTPQFEEWYKEHQIDLDLNLDLDIDVAFEVDLPPASPTPPEDQNQGMDPETVPWNDIIQEIIL